MEVDCTLRPYRPDSEDREAVVALWNRGATETHGFFPLDSALFATRIEGVARFRPERLLLATHAGAVVGMLHYDVVAEPYYASAGTVEAVCVDPAYRRRGIGRALLEAALSALRAERLAFVDGGGGWPYSPFYTTLIDGSERSGPWLHDRAALALFEGAGFRRDRESIVMRHDLQALPPVEPELRIHYGSRSKERTWLDFVFRGWALYDHAAVADEGFSVARAIHGRMEGLSDALGAEWHALFGVYTPEGWRGRGWAGRNLAALLARMAGMGVRGVELHVYSDNEPAVRLYRRAGFQEQGRTTLLRNTFGRETN